jgi:hypothetical protein
MSSIKLKLEKTLYIRRSQTMKTIKTLIKAATTISIISAVYIAVVIIELGALDLITGGGLIISILNIIGWNGLYNIINKYEVEE